jgi:hypothetical protein
MPMAAAVAGILLTAAGPPVVPGPPCGGRAVGHVEVVRHPIFEDDAEPLAWPLRLANRLHILTREDVVRRELLLGAGDCLDREARVETLPDEGGTPAGAQVRVSTFDTWSTVPALRFAKVGNRLVWSAGVSESNLLGRGREVELSRHADLERDQTVLSVRDPRLFGSRVRLGASVFDFSDGRRAELDVGRPFFALTTLWSFRTRLDAFDQRDPLYGDGERVGELRHVARWLDLESARAVRRTESAAWRLHLAYRNRKDEVAGDLRRFGMLEAGFSVMEHRFERLTHVNRFERAEDFNLGQQLVAALGVSAPALGGEAGRVLFASVSERRGFDLGPGRFVVGQLGWKGRHRRGRWENTLGEARLDGLGRLGPRALLLATARYRHGANLDPEVQLTLGAQNGLRAYPVHQWVGSRSLLLAVEGRRFLADDVKRLASFGVAAFAAAGHAWPEGRAVALRDLRGDVGVSLLAGRNRLAGSHPGLRVDLAYAFNPAPGRGRWLVSLGSSFAFVD